MPVQTDQLVVRVVVRIIVRIVNQDLRQNATNSLTSFDNRERSFDDREREGIEGNVTWLAREIYLDTEGSENGREVVLWIGIHRYGQTSLISARWYLSRLRA